MQPQLASSHTGPSTWEAQLQAIEQTAATLRRADRHSAGRETIAAQRDAVARTWERTRARLTELMLERDDAWLAVAQARAEQRLGVPCMALGALEARLEACQAAVEAQQADLARCDALYDTLSARIRQLGAIGR